MLTHIRLGTHLGGQEFIILVTIAFILFGHRLPSVMRHLGRSLVHGPWQDAPPRFRYDSNALWPTSVTDWIVIATLASLLAAIFWQVMTWSN